MEDSVSNRKIMTFRKSSPNKEKPLYSVSDKYKTTADFKILSTIKEETTSSVTYETVIDLLSVGSDKAGETSSIPDRNKMVLKKYSPNEYMSANFIYDQNTLAKNAKVACSIKEDRTNPVTDENTLHLGTLSQKKQAVTNSVADRKEAVFKKHIPSKEKVHSLVSDQSKIVEVSKTLSLATEESADSLSDTKTLFPNPFTADKATVTNLISDRNCDVITNCSPNKNRTVRAVSDQITGMDNLETHNPGKQPSTTFATRKTTEDVKKDNSNKIAELRSVPQYNKLDLKQLISKREKVDNSMTNTNTEELKKLSSPLLHRRRDPMRVRSVSCSFQNREKEHRSNPKHTNNGTKPFSFPDVVEAVMQKPKIHYSDFYKNARRSVAWRKRLEQPWMRGSEMQAFYKMWQFSSHPVPEKKLPKLVHRSESLPKNFKFPGDLCLHEGKDRKPQQAFGILRECCCPPKVRIKTFQEYH